mmetsp:Transcript_43422/g.99496  ORF Transcript_43422/g.99496 Transcript_43422/m.99496 type:complete len:251 (+) Transcript_43422:76-828(+)
MPLTPGMSTAAFRQLSAVIAASAAPRSARSVLNYMMGCDTSDPECRKRLSTDEGVSDLLSVWFECGADLDDLAQPFAPVIKEAKAGTLVEPEWQTIEGKVAKVLLCDQLSRSAFRGTPEAFEYDTTARGVVHELMAPENIDELLTLPCAMLYLIPWALAHSEDVKDLEKACDLINKSAAAYPDFTLFLGRNSQAVEQHRQVLAHFGRYPQRNKQFGRENTPEEEAWLADKDKVPIWAGGKVQFHVKLFEE